VELKSSTWGLLDGEICVEVQQKNEMMGYHDISGIPTSTYLYPYYMVEVYVFCHKDIE